VVIALYDSECTVHVVKWGFICSEKGCTFSGSLYLAPVPHLVKLLPNLA